MADSGGRGSQSPPGGRWLSFLKSTPGVITAIAGLITAITGLIVGLNQAGVIGGGGSTRPGKPAITMNAASSWDSPNTQGSNWHAVVTWSTAGQVKTCDLSDDRGNKSSVDPTGRSYPFGPYSSGVRYVTLDIRCTGPGGDDHQVNTVHQPRAPEAEIAIVRATPAWIDRTKHTHWQIYLTWHSKNAVDCSISDDIGNQSTHKDPIGETHGPYGDFKRQVRSVKLTWKCTNVANAEFPKTREVSRPPVAAT